jgi:hypothetical protein
MRSVLTSRKLNRALPWIAGLVLATGVAVFVQARTDTGAAPQVREPGKVQDNSRVPRSGPVPQEARRVAVIFMQTAVARRNLAKAWSVVGPGLRGGQTRQQWLTGEIGVVPYPGEAVDKAPIRVDWSYPNTVGLSIALLPTSSGEKPQVFQMELKRIGPSKRWVVDSWVPYAPPAVRDSLDQ